jgi:hypothetical protein
MFMTRGYSGYSAEELEYLQRRQAERLRDAKPKPPPRSRGSLNREDWTRIGQALFEALKGW